MAPVNRYPPFSHLQQGLSQPPHQSSHLQQANQHSALASHTSFGPHRPFGLQNGASAAGVGLSVFGPQSTAGNSNLPGGYGAGGLGGGLGNGALGGSQAAQMGFAHAGMGMQQVGDAAVMRGGNQRIKEVWKSNLDEEMAKIRVLIEKYPYVSMDTEFPGIVARPVSEDFGTKSGFHYQTMRCNVDILKIIQLGITLFNEKGEIPPTNALEGLITNGALMVCPAAWNFNFKFNLDLEMYNESSINMLKDAGFDFDKAPIDGIDYDEFGSLLITSGLPFMKKVHWISFHSGYDFGYLTKLMSCKLLPKHDESYKDLIRKYFPNIWDVKFMLRHSQKLRDRGAVNTTVLSLLQSIGGKNSLQDIADELGCARVGAAHTAASDSWLTGLVFFELKTRLFEGNVPQELNGEMWGITGIGPPAPASAQQAALAALQASAHHAVNIANGGSGFAGNSFLQQHGREGPGGPSTPTTNPAGLASQTPGAGAFGAIQTPGAGGAFGNFTYGK